MWLNIKKTKNSIKNLAEDLNKYFSTKELQIAMRYTKRCSTLLIIREMKIQTTMKYHFSLVRISAIQSLSHNWLFMTPWTAAHQASFSTTTPRVYSNSCLSSQWCHPTISFFVVPFSSCLQSFPASGFFQMSQFFASGGHSTGISGATSVLPMNIQDWFPLGWTVWLDLLAAKGLSRVFSNTTVQKHHFYGAQLSL